MCVKQWRKKKYKLLNKCCILKKRTSRCVKCLCDSLAELTHSTCKLAVLHNSSCRQTRLTGLITVSPLQIPYTKVPPAYDETINKVRFLDWKRSSGWLKSWETKCQSLTTVLVRTPITQMIYFSLGTFYSWVQTFSLLTRFQLSKWWIAPSSKKIAYPLDESVGF